LPSVFSPNLGLEEPSTGSQVNAWGGTINSDMSVIDAAMGSSTSVALTNANVTLTVAQSAFFLIICTGTLTGNVELIFPGAIGGRRVVQNNCTGAFTLKVLNGSGDTGGGVIVGQGLQTPILLTAGQCFLDNTGAIPIGAASIASATTTDLGSVPQGSLVVTGTTTITSFGTSAPIGQTKILTFSGVLTLTYNASAIVLPTAANITTAAGDQAIVTQYSTGVWTVIYQRFSGVPFGVSTFAAGVISQPTKQTFVAAFVTSPMVNVFTSGSGTYTTPTGALYLEVEMIGGGSGGGGSGTGAGTGSTAGGNTTFGSSLFVANGGLAAPTAVTSTGPAGAVATGGDDNLTGAVGGPPNSLSSTANNAVSGGAASFYGGGGSPGATQPFVAAGAATSPGAGGGGAGVPNAGALNSGWGGNAGAFLRKLITTPLATYAYAVGTGGAGGPAGTQGAIGGAGAAGYIKIKVYFQ
jgi:hypothetical protein